MTEPLPHLRPDGWPRRCDITLLTTAEWKIRDAVAEAEKCGASTALTDAVTLLLRAADRLADHLEHHNHTETNLVELPGEAVSSARLRELWKMVGGSIKVDRKSSIAWIETDLLAGALHAILNVAVQARCKPTS